MDELVLFNGYNMLDLKFVPHGLVFFFSFYCRSDLLGQFMPLVGKDWSQTGVAHLFSAIKVCCISSYVILVFGNF